MTKDRIAELHKAKGIVVEVDDSTEFHQLYPSTVEVGVKTAKMTKREQSSLKFLHEINRIRADVTSIEEAVHEIKKLHTETLAQYEPDEKRHEQISQLMIKVRALSKNVKLKLADFQKMVEANRKLAEDENLPMTTDMRIKENQYSAVSRRFIDIMKTYLTEQANFQDKCKSRLSRQLKIGK